jgi:hypothetical protein
LLNLSCNHGNVVVIYVCVYIPSFIYVCGINLTYSELLKSTCKHGNVVLIHVCIYIPSFIYVCGINLTPWELIKSSCEAVSDTSVVECIDSESSQNSEGTTPNRSFSAYRSVSLEDFYKIHKKMYVLFMKNVCYLCWCINRYNR